MDSCIERKICAECNQEKDISEFYKHIYKNYKEKEYHTNYLSIYKDCAIKHYDPNNENTFLWMLEELDCPYFKEGHDKYIRYVLQYYPNEQDINKIKRGILGRYLSYMNLHHWLWYRFSDSDFLNKKKLGTFYLVDTA